jgi:hypothetical protein
VVDEEVETVTYDHDHDAARPNMSAPVNEWLGAASSLAATPTMFSTPTAGASSK